MKITKFYFLILAAIVTIAMNADKITNFKLSNLQNKQVELFALLKKGPVLLDFWATWCKPCLKAFPKLDSLHNKYNKQGLVVVGINEDGPRNQAKIKPFVKSLKISFPILIDSNNEVMRRMRVQALPTTILVAPNGTVVLRHIGYSADSMKKLETEIVALLKEYSED